MHKDFVRESIKLIKTLILDHGYNFPYAHVWLQMMDAISTRPVKWSPGYFSFHILNEMYQTIIVKMCIIFALIERPAWKRN